MDGNLATLIEAVADECGDLLALRRGSRDLTFGQVDESAAMLAAGLAAAGITEGSKVGIMAYNSAEYLIGFVAVMKLRAVPVNLNYRYHQSELAEVLDDADAEAVIYHGSVGEVVRAVAPGVGTLRLLIQIDDGSPQEAGVPEFWAYANAHDPAPRIKRSEDDIILLYTGGTTGRPKGVMWPHRLVAFSALGQAYTPLGLTPPSDFAEVAPLAVQLRREGRAPRLCPVAPLMHGQALFVSQLSWLMAGTTYILENTRRFDADELLRVIQRERLTRIVIVGDAFASPLCAALERAEVEGRPYDITSLEVVMSSGTAFSPRYKQGLLDRGRDLVILDNLASSETAAPMAVNMVSSGSRADEARTVLGDRAVLLREDGTVIPPRSNEPGRLAVREPTVDGYYKDPDRTAAIFQVIGGVKYAIPGDWAREDADGSVHFLGRGSLVINTGGEKVYAEEVEEAIRKHPGVKDAQVVGIPHERWGTAVAAVVSLLDSARDTTEADIQGSVRQQLAGYKVPVAVAFVPEVQRSPTGKAKVKWATEVAIAHARSLDDAPASRTTA